MKNLFLILVVSLLIVGLRNDAMSQVLAITKEGQRVILFNNGTWKYESDTIQIEPQPLSPTTEVVPVTPPVVIPPKPKPPRVYSLECSALVDVEKDISSDANVAVMKTLTILKEDSTKAFTLSLMKSKKGSLMWTTKIFGNPCINADNKINIVMKDGTRYMLVTDSKPNCDGLFKLFFGNLDGKDIPLQSMKDIEISSVRIFTAKGFVEASFDEESAKKFKAAINCIAKNL